MARETERDKIIDILVTHIKDVRSDLKDDLYRNHKEVQDKFSKVQTRLNSMDKVLAVNTKELEEHKEGVIQNRKHLQIVEKRQGKLETEHGVMIPDLQEVCEYIRELKGQKRYKKQVADKFFKSLARLRLLWYFLGGAGLSTAIQALIEYLGS